MTDYVILRSTDAYRFNISVVTRAVESVTSTLEYKGTCLYLPSPDGDAGKVILLIDDTKTDKSATDWFLSHLAGYLEAELLDSDGRPYFEDSDETDLSFFESLTPPESEYPMIRLFFALDEADTVEQLTDKLVYFFDNKGYEVNPEADGLTVYLAANSYLDIFITEGGARLSGELDCTYSGAGVYAETVELAEELSRELGLSVSFVENPYITYTQDRDFDKLRREFYTPIKQQLAYAHLDDRDGLQAYYAWGTDAFEVEYRQGTLVTPLGMYDFDRLMDEIRKYGFSYVCDHRLLTRNTPSKCADSEYKEALNLMWNTSVGSRDKFYTDVERELLVHCFTLLEETYNADPFAQFPKALYKRLGKMLESVCMEFTHVHELAVHHEPGYLSGDVFYGFGHYLRRFRLPGSYTRDEQAHGYDVVFCGESSDEFMMECEMVYGYTKDGSESRLGEGFVKCEADDIISFDIGGSSFVRYAECEKSGKWRAEAEVFIKDEIYRFAASSKSYDGMRRLHDALRGAMNVEDWYDEIIREESPDPHANGATFCTNGTTDASGEYSDGFPYSIELFDIPRAIQNKLYGGAKKEDVEAFLHELFESLSERDEDGSQQSDEE